MRAPAAGMLWVSCGLLLLLHSWRLHERSVSSLSAYLCGPVGNCPAGPFLAAAKLCSGEHENFVLCHRAPGSEDDYLRLAFLLPAFNSCLRACALPHVPGSFDRGRWWGRPAVARTLESRACGLGLFAPPPRGGGGKESCMAGLFSLAPWQLPNGIPKP